VTSSATSLARYILGTQGQDSCPGGSSKITTEAECRTASVSPGGNRPFQGAGSWTDRFSWCQTFGDFQSFYVQFNSNPNGASVCVECVLICKIDSASYTP
jgi:hypothetical protein